MHNVISHKKLLEKQIIRKDIGAMMAELSPSDKIAQEMAILFDMLGRCQWRYDQAVKRERLERRNVHTITLET